ncbi:ABC transporter, partial [Nostocales cyanobacterium LEGE 12452]|nr:ABC transporter [Nostocales cyanobacterium LEGE 12452]
MIGFIQQLRRRTPLGWLQLSHEKGRLLVALSGIAFADVLMFMQLGFQNALFESNTILHRSMQADMFVISPQARNLANMSSFTRRRLYQVMDIPGVKSAEGMYINIVDWKNPQTQQKTTILVMGFNPDQQVFNLADVNRQIDAIKLPDTVLFDRASRGDYNDAIAQIDQGKTVTTEIERRTITISGLFSVGASFIADGTLITNDQNFLRLFPRREASGVSLGLVQLQPGYDPKQMKTILETY